TSLPDLLIHLRAGLEDDLLDAAGMDAAVHDEVGERQPGGLAADRIEPGEDHGIRGIVDDQVHTGQRLEGTDIATLTATDPALTVGGGEWHDGDGRLRGLVHGAALHGVDNNLPRLALRIGF